MKILFVGPTSGLSGVDQTMRMLCIGLVQRGHTVNAVLPKKSAIKKDLVDAGVFVTESPLIKWWFNPAFFDNYIVEASEQSKPSVDHLCTVIRNAKPDVVVSNSSVFLDAALAAKICGKPHVTHMHALFVDNIYTTMSTDFKSSIYQLLTSEGCSIITPTKEIAQTLNGYGLNREAITIVPNGVDTDKFHHKSSHTDSAKKLTVLSLGHFNANKNQLFLVEVALELKRSGRNDVLFKLTGPGEEEYINSLKNSIERSKVGSFFEISAHTNDVIPLLQDADIYVNTSITESFPVSVLEAMACGVPVICTPTIGAKEIIAHGSSGFICADIQSFASAICQLADNTELRRTIGKSGRSRAIEEFSLNQFVRNFEAALSKGCSSSPQASPWLQSIFLKPTRPAKTKSQCRVCVIVPDRGQTSFELLIKKPFEHFAREESDFEFKVFDYSQLTSLETTSFDLIYVLRVFADNVINILLEAEQAGIPVIFETDDNYFALHFSDGNPVHENQRNLQLEHLLTLSTQVIVYSNPMLAAVKSHNTEVLRLPPYQVFPDTPQKTGTTRHPIIGFMGSLKKDIDFSVVTPALEQLLQEIPDLRLEFFGFVPEEFQHHSRVISVPFNSNYDQFLAQFRSREWTIGLAPLANTEFNRSKTNNKYREYAAAGYAGVYSDVGPYSESVIPNQTGLLVSNTPEAWYEAMLLLLRNSNLRTNIAKCAYSDVEEKFSFKAHTTAKWALIQKVLSEHEAFKSITFARELRCNWHPQPKKFFTKPQACNLPGNTYESTVIKEFSGQLYEVNLILQDFIKSPDVYVGIELVIADTIALHQVHSVMSAERNAVFKFTFPAGIAIDSPLEIRVFARSAIGAVKILGNKSIFTRKTTPVLGLVFSEDTA